MKNSEKKEKKFDVTFNDDTNSNCNGFLQTFQYCKDWIKCNRNDKSSYFADYKGGTVSIIDVNSGTVLYSEEIN